MSDPLVAIEAGAIGHGGRAFLEGIALAVRPGDFLAVVGPNGGGKTTLLRALLGALPLVAGRVARAPTLRVGYVPQRDHVDPIWPFTAGEVVMMGRVPALGLLRRPGARDHAEVRRALAQVGIENLEDWRYGELSGGQRQRTLIARALAAGPELLVLDEPTSGMDPGAELATMDLLARLHHDGGLAVLMVSHRLEAVANYARTLAFVDKDQRLFRIGPLEEMLRPEALGALYGRPVRVEVIDGRRIVYPVSDAPVRSGRSLAAGEAESTGGGGVTP